MPYDYQTEKPRLFTDEGQKMFLKMRDHTQDLLAKSGAVRMQEMMKCTGGDTWQMLACADRMVELGELTEIHQMEIPAQYRIFIKSYR